MALIAGTDRLCCQQLLNDNLRPDYIQLIVDMQVMSGGLLRATPHCVKAPCRDMSGGVSRNTLAVFMQPRSGLLGCPDL